MTIEEVLLLLNTLIYTNTNESVIYKEWGNKSIFEIVNKPELFIKPGDEIATQEEWEALRNTVNHNSEYFSQIRVEKVEAVNQAQRNITFVNDDSKEVYIVYRGTGKLEWIDNAKIGDITISATPQQLNALEFANGVTNNVQYKDYKIYASGHSKGGNKAMFVGMLNDDIDYVYSYDGNGMGEGFLYTYAEKISRNKHKVTSISNRSDYVNVQYQSVAGIVLLTVNEIDIRNEI